jgi:hypothetical protein
MNLQLFAGGTHRLVRLEAAHRALPSAVDPNGAPWAGGYGLITGCVPLFK